MSSEDSAAIFGRGAASAWPVIGQPEANDDEAEVDEADSGDPHEAGQHTSNMSLHDYFAKCVS